MSTMQKGKKMIFNTYLEALQWAKDNGLIYFKIIPVIKDEIFKFKVEEE